MKMNPLKICLVFIISIFFIQHIFCQGFAGEDKIICVGGSTIIGTETDGCKGCCKWTPEIGLDDPSSPMPTVSGLTTTTEYTKIISDNAGGVVTDKVTVYVCSIDLDIYKPLFINEPSDPNEHLVAENMEESVGAQTFVNLDSDDNDFSFDIADNLVDGGDDEFIKLEIKITYIGASSLPETDISSACIKGFAGSEMSSIKIWQSKDKNLGEYTLGDFLPFPASNTTSSIFLWVEGISAHTIQKAVKLFAEAAGKSDNAVLCPSSNVSVTILGVQSMQWLGMENGYTGNGLNNSNTLDSHSSENGYPDHIRVFPEAKFSGSAPTNDSKDKVKLDVTLSVKPVEPIPIYLRLIDADDPSSAYNHVDFNDKPSNTTGTYPGSAGLTYDENNDNRGVVDGNKYGKLLPLLTTDPNFTKIDALIGLYKYVISDDAFSLKVQVSPYAGDNYLICLYGDINFIRKVRNLDKYDKEKLVFEANDPSIGQNDYPPIHSSLLSQILTVWRTLHIEYDKMKNPNWDDNFYFKGYFHDFEGAAPGIDILTKVGKLLSLRPASNTGYISVSKPLKDQSSGNGRFRNGIVRIGDNTNLQTLCSSPSPCIAKNGDDFIELSGSQDGTFGGTLTCTLKKTGQIDLQVNVLEIEKIIDPSGPTFKVVVQSPSSINLFAYNGGQISIANGPFCSNCVETTSGNDLSLTLLPTGGKSNLKIPIQVFDDDDIPLSGNSSLISDLDFTTTKSAFAEAYIDACADGGGKLENNTIVPFTRNIDKVGTGGINNDPYSPFEIGFYYDLYANSIDYEKPSYWVVYLISAWQYHTSNDNDPHSEAGAFGVAANIDGNLMDCEIKLGGYASAVFHESIREYGNFNLYSRGTTAHELGHQCGLTHGNKDNSDGSCSSCYAIPPGCPDNMGLMSPNSPHVPETFVPFQINLLRSRFKSPGTDN